MVETVKRTMKRLHVWESPLLHGDAVAIVPVEVIYEPHEYTWWFINGRDGSLGIGIHPGGEQLPGIHSCPHTVIKHNMFAKVWEEVSEVPEEVDVSDEPTGFMPYVGDDTVALDAGDFVQAMKDAARTQTLTVLPSDPVVDTPTELLPELPKTFDPLVIERLVDRAWKEPFANVPGPVTEVFEKIALDTLDEKPLMTPEEDIDPSDETGGIRSHRA